MPQLTINFIIRHLTDTYNAQFEINQKKKTVFFFSGERLRNQFSYCRHHAQHIISGHVDRIHDCKNSKPSTSLIFVIKANIILYRFEFLFFIISKCSPTVRLRSFFIEASNNMTHVKSFKPGERQNLGQCDATPLSQQINKEKENRSKTREFFNYEITNNS